MTQEKSTPVTIRLENRCLAALRKKAQGKQSFNSLVHQILDKYVDYYQHLENFDPIVITKESFKTILNMLDQKQCVKLADDVAKKEAIEFIHFKHGKMDMDTILEFMRMFFEYCGYGHHIEEVDDGRIIFRIRHGMGKNGSLYIKTFVETLMENANLPKPESTSTGNGIVFKFMYTDMPNRYIQHLHQHNSEYMS